MKSNVRIFDEVFLDALCAEAVAVPRRRKNANIHTRQDALCQRFFNALEADTYVRPHRHVEAEKDETVLLLRGKLGLIEFADDGQVLFTHVMLPGMTVDIPHGVLHGWICLADGSLFFEAKAGPYSPMMDKEWATFAPAEGEPGVPAYLAKLRALFEATG